LRSPFQIDDLVQKALGQERDAKEADEMKLAPGRGSRLRRKSKELKDECMSLMGSQLEAAFKQFDLDGNGTLDRAELTAAYVRQPRPRAQSHSRRPATPSTCLPHPPTPSPHIVSRKRLGGQSMRRSWTRWWT
jgi:hypothetical protein